MRAFPSYTQSTGDAKSIALLVGLGFFNTYLLSATGSVYAQSTSPRGYQNASESFFLLLPEKEFAQMINVTNAYEFA